MKTRDINTETTEGKLLVIAVYELINSPLPGFKGKTPDEVLTKLDEVKRAVEAS